MTDETRQSPAETVSHEHLKSVVHRRGPLTKADYSEAIGDLKRARMQDRIAHICCSVCEDTGHTAESCNHNPLVLARKWSEATSVWCCYHCGFVATNEEEARDHFGFNEQVPSKCRRRPRPIETAPKDGREFLALMHDGREPPNPFWQIISWNDHGRGEGAWMERDGMEYFEQAMAEAKGYARPLSWLPLPPIEPNPAAGKDG